ncbi:MAG: tyrosine-type recombinase/integrase, partial [Candidatus Binatia bacterium]
MTMNRFSGPLAADFEAFVDTLEASASANKTTLVQLRALDRFTKQRLPVSGTIDEALARAWLTPCATRGPNTRRSRYYLLRRFCRFLAKRRLGTFVPGERLRPRGRAPKPPHIYSREEVRGLLDAALSLRDWKSWHPCPIRSKTMHAIVLLLATSGLRISEALHLTLEDVDLEGGVLSIRQSKFRKSRLVPLSPGTVQALRRYHAIRIAVARTDPSAALFISGRGQAYSTGCVQGMFRTIAIQAGLRGPTGRG